MQNLALFMIAMGGLLLFAGFICLIIGGFKHGNHPANLADAFLGGPFAFIRGFRMGLRDAKSPMRPVLAVFLFGATLLFLGVGSMPMKDANSPRQAPAEPPASSP